MKSHPTFMYKIMHGTVHPRYYCWGGNRVYVYLQCSGLTPCKFANLANFNQNDLKPRYIENILVLLPMFLYCFLKHMPITTFFDTHSLAQVPLEASSQKHTKV